MAIYEAVVGQMVFDQPSPNWNASTHACLERPNISARGEMMGITTTASPDPAGMKKSMSITARKIPTIVNTCGK